MENGTTDDIINESILDNMDDYEIEIYIRDIDDDFINDIQDNSGFLITDRDGLEKNTSKRLEDGIYSPKYGSIWQDENAFEELYSCDCGDLKGNIYSGRECLRCKSKVRYRDKDISKCGYLRLDSYQVIHLTLYKLLGSLIGLTRLKHILEPKWKTDAKGRSYEYRTMVDVNIKNIEKYNHIGMIEFINRFDEILEFFYLKKKDKKSVYDFIKENRNKVFVKSIPVISLILRPLDVGDEDLRVDPVNSIYSMLSAKVYSLNDKMSILTEDNAKRVNYRLFQIQLKLDELCNNLEEKMNGKNGIIRRDMQGSRYDHSARGVIIPMNGGKTNEVVMPYLMFLILYKPEIINMLMKLDGITINEALVSWNKAMVKFNKKVYTIMKYLVEHYDLYILLNRNPKQELGLIA